MKSASFSLLCSLVYFGLAVYAVKQVHTDGVNGQFLAQFLTVCGVADVIGIALLAQSASSQRVFCMPRIVRRAAKKMRLLSGVLTVPCIVYWGTGEALLHPTHPHVSWKRSVTVFAEVKRYLEGEDAANAYLMNAAHHSGNTGAAYEALNDLLSAYDFYSMYAELLNEASLGAESSVIKNSSAVGAMTLGRILDKMGRYREADRQYEIAERQYPSNPTYKMIADARLLRMLKDVPERSALKRYVNNLVLTDPDTTALKMGSLVTAVDRRRIMFDWRKSDDMRAGVAYSGAHMRDLLSKIDMRSPEAIAVVGNASIDNFDFGKPPLAGTYLEPRSFQPDLEYSRVILPTDQYEKLVKLSRK